MATTMYVHTPCNKLDSKKLTNDGCGGSHTECQFHLGIFGQHAD